MSASKVRDYSELLRNLEGCLNGAGQMISLGKICEGDRNHEFRKIVLGKKNSRKVLISAGIHGDEPAGVATVCEFLRTRCYEPYLDYWELTILPCLNPTGYESGKRENFMGSDLNRMFKSPVPPQEVLFAQSVFNQTYDLTLELHEDTDSSGYYLYQKVRSGFGVGPGRVILNAVSELMPINMNSEVDGFPASQGLLDRLKEPEDMEWWPMALYALSKGVGCCLTLETATLHPVSTRVKAHLMAIRQALDFFRGR